MSDVFAARSQMAVSLGFHIIFAAIGIAMPFLMAASHWRWLRTGDEVYRDLTRAWSKGVAIFFAVGAVSGTVLSFELGLLWPKFMRFAGPIIGMPFSWEGTAFFLEAIAIGFFLYGWNRLRPWVHWASGLAVGLCGVASALFVVCANGWMNSPTGFELVNGEVTRIDPWAAMFNRAALGEGVHMVLAAFAATGFAAAGLHALGLLRNRQSRFHAAALRIALTIGALAAIAQPLSGDRLAKSVTERQPLKLAAMEALFETRAQAPLLIGGWPAVDERKVHFGIELPALLSFLARGDFHATVQGLGDFPRGLWPPVPVVHLAFQLMVGLGTLLALTGALALWWNARRNPAFVDERFLRWLVALTPLGFIALEAGWVVTEVGRQPWVIYGFLKTADAVTPMPGLLIPFILFSLVYLFLSFVVGWLMWRQFKNVA